MRDSSFVQIERPKARDLKKRRLQQRSRQRETEIRCEVSDLLQHFRCVQVGGLEAFDIRLGQELLGRIFGSGSFRSGSVDYSKTAFAGAAQDAGAYLLALMKKPPPTMPAQIDPLISNQPFERAWRGMQHEKPLGAAYPAIDFNDAFAYGKR